MDAIARKRYKQFRDERNWAYQEEYDEENKEEKRSGILSDNTYEFREDEYFESLSAANLKASQDSSNPLEINKHSIQITIDGVRMEMTLQQLMLMMWIDPAYINQVDWTDLPQLLQAQVI